MIALTVAMIHLHGVEIWWASRSSNSGYYEANVYSRRLASPSIQQAYSIGVSFTTFARGRYRHCDNQISDLLGSHTTCRLSVRALICFGRRVCLSVCLLSVCPASYLGNYARYARNFVALKRNRGRRARI